MSSKEEISCKLFDIRKWIPEFSIGKSVFFPLFLINGQIIVFAVTNYHKNVQLLEPRKKFIY